jgi:glycine cleavage system H protein
MPIVRGCNLPDDLLYDVDNNIWYRENADGTVTLGMTAVAAAMAGPLVAFTPKKAGRPVAGGKSCAGRIRQVGRPGEDCLRRGRDRNQ